MIDVPRCVEGGTLWPQSVPAERKGFHNRALWKLFLSPLQQRPFFLLLEERVSCFLSSIVFYWRWQALEWAFLALQKTSTCRKRKFLQGEEAETSRQKECNNRHPASPLLSEEPTNPCGPLAEPLEIEPLPGMLKQQTCKDICVIYLRNLVDQSLSFGVPSTQHFGDLM